MPTGGATIFLLDANVFIQAHRRYYTQDICPGFWELLTHYGGGERLRSLDKVKKEIKEGDTLAQWVKNAPSGFFVSSQDQGVVDTFMEIMEWVDGHGQFLPSAKTDFADQADGWLAAYAKVHGDVLVTHEIYDPHVKRKVPLANICRKFSVPYRNTFDMLRDLEAQFDWSG